MEILRQVSVQTILIGGAHGFPDKGGRSKLPPRRKVQHLLTQPHVFYSHPFLFLSLWLLWVFIAVQRISLVAASGVHSLLCVGFGAMASLVEEHKVKRHWLH